MATTLMIIAVIYSMLPNQVLGSGLVVTSEDPAELEEIFVMGGWVEVGKEGAEAEVVGEEVELDLGEGVADSVWELGNVDDWYQR